jgi:hypothetical protein
VPAGATIANHALMSNPGSVSAIAGQSDSSGERFSDVTPSARSRPALGLCDGVSEIDERECERAGDHVGHSLRNALVGHAHDVQAGHAGQHRNADLRARRAVAGRQLARMRLGVRDQLRHVLTGSLGFTISTRALVPMRATGAKSFTGS